MARATQLADLARSLWHEDTGSESYAIHLPDSARSRLTGGASIFVQDNPARQYLDASLESSTQDNDSALMPDAALDDEEEDSPFHSGEAPKAGWHMHRTAAELPVDDGRIQETVKDSWIPSTARYGLREPPPETVASTPRAQGEAIYVYPAPAREQQPSHRDASWVVVWFFSMLFVVASGLWAAFEPAPISVPDNIGASAFAVLASLPLLTLFTLLSLLAGASAMAYLFLVRTSVRHLVLGGMIGAPVVLLLTAAWSWGGSWQGYGQAGTETEGERETLRWFSLALVLLAGLTAKLGYDRRQRINRTVQVVELASEVLMLHPQLFVVCLGATAAFLVFTVPVLTISARLLLVAAAAPDSGWPTSLAFFTGFVWLWTLGIVRGVQRLAVAGAVGHWFFSRHEPQATSPSELVVDALKRATGPSLGSACFAALVLAVLDSLVLVLNHLRRLTRASHLPFFLSPIYILAPLVTFLTGVVEGLSSFALAYAGVTGDSFWPSARAASALITRTGTARAFDYLLVKLLLNLVSLALSLLFGLAGYLSSATAATHHHPGLVAVICFAIPFWTIRSCSDVLGHAVDAIFICWSLDIDANQNHCTKAAQAFGEPVGLSLPR